MQLSPPAASRRLLPLLTAAALLGLAGGARAADGSKDAACLGCHGAMAGARVSFEDGSSLPILVDADSWHHSVHGDKLACTDCHRDISGYPHDVEPSPDARSFQLRAAESCRNCHYAYYTRVLDSIHFKELQAGNPAAPTCTDCHGAHDIQPPGTPRTAIQDRCAKCHPDVAKTYAQSVHGRTLAADPDAPVPTCTDCHGAHDIHDPRNAAFHADSWKICADCHGDAERMKPYGLSPDVVTTYLDDFHGVSNRLYSMGAGEPGRPIAVCTDCHGFHDIQPFDDAGTTEQVQARVAQLCQKCHEGATPNFSKAWLSHYPPTLDKAPLVWAVKWVYRLMIPGIMLGLVLHILLHLWRLRGRRNA